MGEPIAFDMDADGTVEFYIDSDGDATQMMPQLHDAFNFGLVDILAVAVFWACAGTLVLAWFMARDRKRKDSFWATEDSEGEDTPVQIMAAIAIVILWPAVLCYMLASLIAFGRKQNG